jgi:hypothetical protein
MHCDRPLWKLAIDGAANALQDYGRFNDVEGFVQFIGFPRSGHSLIGSLIDAHPEAIVSHELDTMGLLKKGFPERLLYGLIRNNSAEFTHHGRYWNGFSYVVPGQHNGQAEPLTVIGDKKGDWTVRWYQKSPHLIDTVYRTIRADCKWILVTRNPLDNIATMSLRESGPYDTLRIASDESSAFNAALKRHQERGEIASEVRDDMIDDYAELCQTIDRMRTEIPSADQYHLQYERFCTHPTKELRDLCRFLELPPRKDYLSSCASIVRPSSNNRRQSVQWTDHQQERVSALSERHSFLHSYVDDMRVHA